MRLKSIITRHPIFIIRRSKIDKFSHPPQPIEGDVGIDGFDLGDALGDEGGVAAGGDDVDF